MASKQDIAYRQGLSEADPILKIFDYDVLDKTGEKVGTVNNIWPERDQSGIAFLGVRTGWLFGRDHVIPAQSMRVNHDDQTVTLPLARDEIKRAPDFNLSGELSEDDSIRVREYYATFMPHRQEAEADARGTVEVPVREEKVKVGKREVEDGGIRIRRVVRKETVDTPVELRREDVVVERVPASEAKSADRSIREGETYIPLKREEPVVEKSAEVTGAVGIQKTSQPVKKEMRETVRKEDVKVEREGRAAREKGSQDRDCGCEPR